MFDLYVVGMRGAPNYLKNTTFAKVVDEIAVTLLVPTVILLILK